MGMIGDYILILISQRNEEKRIKNGQVKNENLPNNIQKERIMLEMQASEGDAKAAHRLGSMYIEGDKLGYAPDLAEKYFKIAAKKNYFDSVYALAMFYKGYWSYCHLDLYKSYTYYVQASRCTCDDPKYMAEVRRMLNEELCINTKEKDKNGNPMVWTKHDIKIK
ncbi:MAG: hypothetical protein NC489_33195 [Ruminococcus flavefaciens]|nr:hypothetical protein [Ruminococcus flavefaciens]